MKTLISICFAFIIFVSTTVAEDKVSCKSLDTREFGLVSAGEITEPWSEAQLIEKYGTPCQIIDLGGVYIERSRERIVELGPKISEQEKIKTGTVAVKKQFIYSGDASSRTSVFTIIDGVVVKKERIF